MLPLAFTIAIALNLLWSYRSRFLIAFLPLLKGGAEHDTL
jgi:hypothetical protein